jgi:hypothetical protein
MSKRLLAVVAALGMGGAVLVAAPVAQAAVPDAPAPSAVLTANTDFGVATTVTVDWTNSATPAASAVTVSSQPAAPAGATGTCTQPLASTATTCEYIGLTVGQPYVFTVAVTNDDGTTSGNTVPLTPSTTPAAPAIVASTNGNEQVWVDWSVPNNGGSAITRYDVYVNNVLSDVVGCFNTTNTDCVITGLTNSTSYSITVTASNVQGESALSAVRLVTPSLGAGLTDAPTGVSAVQVSDGGDKKIQVSFTPPAAVAGFPTTGFDVTCVRTAGTASADLTGSGTQSPILTGVGTAGTTYTCTVTATNDNGESAVSAVSNAVTINDTDVPGAPTIGTATGGSLQATVTWSAPSPLPISPITGYQVQYFATGASDWSSPIVTGSTATTFTVTGLAEGTYRFRVRAVNAGGVSAWSNESALVTVTAGTLNAPTGVSGTPGLAQVSLTWAAPSGGTLTPTSYQVRYSSNAGATWTEVAATGTTVTSAVVTGLVNGTSYVFAVRAISGGTNSEWSATSAAVTPGAPGVPTNVTGTAGNTQVMLMWTAPAGTPAATGYQVQYSTNSGVTWLPLVPLTSASTTPAFTVTGLTNGTAYVFRVRAVNGPVEGEWSATSAAVTPVTPVTPTIIIQGTRGVGNESRRIFVQGQTTGLAVGTVLAPFIRFPGEVGMTIGKARRQVNAQSQFEWTRLTGKRIAVRFATPQDEHRSNRIIIEAR